MRFTVTDQTFIKEMSHQIICNKYQVSSDDATQVVFHQILSEIMININENYQRKKK